MHNCITILCLKLHFGEGRGRAGRERERESSLQGTSYGLEDGNNLIRFPRAALYSSLLPKTPTIPVTRQVSYTKRSRCLLPWVEWPGRCTDHSSPPRPRMSGAMPPISHKSSRCEQGIHFSRVTNF